jgi:hypothetical protein
LNALPPPRLGDGPTWCVYLLPYLEQGPIYDAFDFRFPWPSQSSPAVKTWLEGFVCPTRRKPMMSIASDDHAGIQLWPGFPNPYPATPQNPGPVGDYAVSIGHTLSDSSPLEAGVPGSGAFGQRNIHPAQYATTGYPVGYQIPPGRLRFNDVLDGLSNTLFIGEKHVHQRNLGHTQGPDWAGTQICFDNCLYNGSGPLTSGRPAGPGFALASGKDPCGDGSSARFGSWHPGGVNFALGDASVHSLNFATSDTVLKKLATRKGGEAIELP